MVVFYIKIHNKKTKAGREKKLFNQKNMKSGRISHLKLKLSHLAQIATIP